MFHGGCLSIRSPSFCYFMRVTHIEGSSNAYHVTKSCKVNVSKLNNLVQAVRMLWWAIVGLSPHSNEVLLPFYSLLFVRPFVHSFIRSNLTFISHTKKLAIGLNKIRRPPVTFIEKRKAVDGTEIKTPN